MRKRSQTVSFRLTENEKAFFDELQKRTGMPKHKLVLAALTRAKLPSKECVEELKRLNVNTAYLAEQVKKIGVNINQIAHVANATGQISDIQEIAKFSQHLLAIQKGCELLWQYSNQSMRKLL